MAEGKVVNEREQKLADGVEFLYFSLETTRVIKTSGNVRIKFSKVDGYSFHGYNVTCTEDKQGLQEIQIEEKIQDMLFLDQTPFERYMYIYNSMIGIVNTPVSSVEVVINPVVERFDANPTNVCPAMTMNMVTPLDLLDKDPTIRALFDVRVTLRPPRQQPLLATLRSDQRILLTTQPTVGRPVAV